MVADKVALRMQLQASRARIPEAARTSRSTEACRAVFNAIPQAQRRTVALYRSIGSELDCSSLHEALVAEGAITCCPRSMRTSLGLEFSAVQATEEMQPGMLHIPEPVGQHPRVPLSELTAIIVPGVAFSVREVRLGYGAGYYGRTLANYNGLIVGVCFAEQIVDELPEEVHDIAMQMVVSGASGVVVGVFIARRWFLSQAKSEKKRVSQKRGINLMVQA